MYGRGRESSVTVLWPVKGVIMSSKKIITYGSALLVLAAIYFGRAAYRAHLNLVTLDVRDMDVREVVNKMEHQTWEVIFVEKAVEGKITMQVEKMPLEEALRLVGSQASARASTIYPLYSTSQSFKALKESLRGEVDPATHGWTNLQSRGMAFGGMGAMGGMGGGGARGGLGALMGGAVPNQLVSLSISAKDVAFASLALNRFASARVVPEDGVNATVSFMVKQVSVPEAVAKLAKAADRKWTTLYALQSFGGPGGPGGRGGLAGFGGRGPGGPPPTGGDTNSPPRRGGFGGFGDPDMTDEQRAEARKQREALDQELLATLPAEERQKIEDAQAERDKLMQEMANMTDEQRRDRMMQLMGPAIDKMARDRLLNSTPEQRAKMRGPGGFGGPGGPGGGGRGGPGR